VNSRYAETAARANHRCEYCRAPEIAFNFPFEVEHITPPGAGGSDDSENLALACRSCNIYKANLLTSIDPTTGKLARLFNPRVDQWSEHFAVDDADRVIGQTSIGYATVELLRMNSQPQCDARRWWRALGLFP